MSETEQGCHDGAVGHAPALAFHARLKPRPADAYLALRALVLSLGPDVTERVSESSVCYERRGKVFLTLHAHRGARMRAVFPEDVPLDDPEGRLLRRAGDRYAALDAPEHLDSHLTEFIRKSYAGSR